MEDPNLNAGHLIAALVLTVFFVFHGYTDLFAAITPVSLAVLAATMVATTILGHWSWQWARTNLV